MFRTLIHSSSGACDCVDELPHRSSCSQFVVCWSFCCGWYLVVFVVRVGGLVLQPAKRTPPNISRSKNSNTQRTENKTTDVVIHQRSRSLLKMDVLMSETCWAHDKWGRMASDIKLVFHSSNIEHHSVKGVQLLLSSTLGIILNSPNIWRCCLSAVLNSKVKGDVERLLVWPTYVSWATSLVWVSD
jgi:hypothetical protein